MSFKFDNDNDRDCITDMSPWEVHDHCLNLKTCEVIQCLEDVDLSWIQIWVQVHGLNPDMLNNDNTQKSLKI